VVGDRRGRDVAGAFRHRVARRRRPGQTVPCKPALLLVVLAVLGAGCAVDRGTESAVAPTPKPLIVVTTSILGDVVTNIVADDADVTVLIPLNEDSRSYQATVRQEPIVGEADAVVWTGLGLELGLTSMITELDQRGVTVIAAGTDVDPIESTDAPGRVDPAFWMDAQRMARAVVSIGQRLGEAHPALDTSRVRSRAAAYAAEVRAADAEAMGTLAGIPSERRVLVTNDDSWAYFGDRYNFEIRTIPGASMALPAEGDLDALSNELVRLGVNAVFAEATKSARSAFALAEQTDGQLLEVYSDSLGGPGSGFETYTGLIRANADRVAEGLGHRVP